MRRTLIYSFLLVGGFAMAQDVSKAKDRSTAQTAGETNRMENMASDKTLVMNAANRRPGRGRDGQTRRAEGDR